MASESQSSTDPASPWWGRPASYWSGASLLCAVGAFVLWFLAQRTAAALLHDAVYMTCQTLTDTSSLDHMYRLYEIAGLLALGGIVCALLAFWRRSASRSSPAWSQRIAALGLLGSVGLLLLIARSALDVWGARYSACIG
jgi:hypothetical protein